LAIRRSFSLPVCWLFWAEMGRSSERYKVSGVAIDRSWQLRLRMARQQCSPSVTTVTRHAPYRLTP
jgi:hypothetical protein